VTLTALPDGSGWEVDGTSFVFEFGGGSTPDRFLIRKRQSLVDRYVVLAEQLQGGVIVELGIAAGGSTALLSLLTRPSLLVACELAAEPVGALDEFIAARGLEGIVRPHYGVDQGDKERLAAIVDGARGALPLDLVIDDASHRYSETLASFEVLFPRLRPGGRYIVEDWAADYAFAARITEALAEPGAAADAMEARLSVARAEHPEGLAPLPRLGVELLEVAGTHPHVVRDLTIDHHWLSVARGDADLDAAAFSLAEHRHDPWGWSTT
jgi:predicted O-methyltransferase YrrM